MAGVRRGWCRSGRRAVITAVAISGLVVSGVAGGASAASGPRGPRAVGPDWIRAAAEALAAPRAQTPPAAPGPGWTAVSSSTGGVVYASSCYGSSFTDSPDAPELDPIAYSLNLDCANAHSWTFDVRTRDSWPDSELQFVVLKANTDQNAATGCNGFDRVIVGLYDTTSTPHGLTAGEVDTPSCDQTTWLVGPAATIARANANDVSLTFPNAFLGNPASFAWQGGIKGVSESVVDLMPDAGTHTAQGYPVGDACEAASLAGSDEVGTSARQFAVTADPAEAAAAVSALGGAGLEDISRRGSLVVSFTGDAARAAGALHAAGVTATVAADRSLAWTDLPNDPLFPSQWSLSAVNAAGAWALTHGSSSVVVADLDSGVDASHPDLAGKLVGGYDVTTNQPLPAGNSDNVGHGTAVAGVIGAATNNGIGLASLGWDTPVMPIKIGDTPTLSTIVAGLHWAADHGARIINLSLGGCADPTLAAAVQYAQSKGALLVAAAGNQGDLGNPVIYPAAYPGVLAVGATARNGSHAFYSETGSFLGMVAPGGSGDGTPADDVLVLVPGGGYGTGAGTSFAAPLVAAAGGLLDAVNPGLLPDDVAGILRQTATHLGAPGPDPVYGTGMLNAGAAATAAGKVARLAGGDRYATAAVISRDGFPTGAANVLVASGVGFADALASGPLAKQLGGPLLLTDTCTLPTATHDELVRLHPTSVRIVGGLAAVCAGVVSAIQSATGVTPVRVAGSDRYGTAAGLSHEGWGGTSSVVYVASGANFPDGLAGAPRAALDSAPMLLTDTCTLPTTTHDELARLHPTKVVLLGGAVAICDAVASSIASAAGVTPVRLSGPTRYDTAAAVAADGWPSGTSTTYVASGGAFPDALAAGPRAGASGSPLLLVAPCSVPSGTLSELQGLHPAHLVVLGGPSAVCGDALGRAAAALP